MAAASAFADLMGVWAFIFFMKNKKGKENVGRCHLQSHLLLLMVGQPGCQFEGMALFQQVTSKTVFSAEIISILVSFLGHSPVPSDAVGKAPQGSGGTRLEVWHPSRPQHLPMVICRTPATKIHT